MATAIESHEPATRAATEAEPEGLYEVVDGQVVEKPPMGAFEADIASTLFLSLSLFARERRTGRVFSEMLFRIDGERRLSRRPDVAFVSADRWPIGRKAPRSAAWEIVPDLAVEVISPSNKTAEDARKVEDYFAAGVRMVWVVFPGTGTVYVYDGPRTVRILGRGDELDGGDVLPGFRLPLATLFDDGAE